jgi:CRISPR-associated protein Cas2
MALSGYRMMWMMVLFDLPVTTRAERREAVQFRKYLLDQGFEMAQFSVYLRFCSSKEQSQRYARGIQANLPQAGKVYILVFTDKQYEKMQCFHGGEPSSAPENPKQYVLF